MKTETNTIKDGDIIAKDCCRCGASFQTPAYFLWEERRIGMEQSNCDQCTKIIEAENAAEAAERSRSEKEQRKARNLEALKKHLAEKIPRLFQGTDSNHPSFNKERFKKIGNYRWTPEKPWLGLIGVAGKCKSRIAFMVAAEFLEYFTIEDESVPDFIFTNSDSINTAVGRQYDRRPGTARNSYNHPTGTIGEEAKDFLLSLRDVDLLLIDDLGKGGMTQAVAAEMFGLINHRYSEQLPMIWTANSTPEEIASSMRGDFTDDMRGPFAGRLAESSKIYQFK